MQPTCWNSPMGTDGFEFTEYAVPEPAAMGAVCERTSCRPVAKHRDEAVTPHRQGGSAVMLKAEADPAIGSSDLLRPVDGLRASGVGLHDPIDTRLELVDGRIPRPSDDVRVSRSRRILIDGKPGELRLQIVSESQPGSIVFQFIRRNGDPGFGEGSGKTLFEGFEPDPMRRGALAA